MPFSRSRMRTRRGTMENGCQCSRSMAQRIVHPGGRGKTTQPREPPSSWSPAAGRFCAPMDRTGPNAGQITYWNDTAGPKWVALEEKLDGQIRDLGEAT